MQQIASGSKLSTAPVVTRHASMGPCASGRRLVSRALQEAAPLTQEPTLASSGHSNGANSVDGNFTIEPLSPEVAALMEEQSIDFEKSGLKFLSNDARVCRAKCLELIES